MKNRKYTKYTKEVLEVAVRDSLTMREVLRKCGAPDLSGGTHAHVSKRVKAYGIDTSHFMKSGYRIGYLSSNKKTADEILIRRYDGSRNRAAQLVRALLEIGRPYKCFVCGLREWMHKKIVFEIEHKDGDFQNDTRENIEFICPNCHSQTPSFCRKKSLPDTNPLPPAKKKARERMKRYRKPSMEGYWRTRDKPDSRKVDRPNKALLASLLLSTPMVKIGEKYGVSDNAVRKWAKRYGLEMPTRFGKSRSRKVGT